MRLLCTFVGGTGHLNPLVPIAHAAVSAGHAVAISGRPDMRQVVEATGLPYIPSGAASGEPTTLTALAPPDAAREDRVLRVGFADRIARRRASDLRAIATDWRADAIVCDEIDFGAMIAAERLGLPHVTVLVIAAGSFVRPEVVAAPLDAVRAANGLPPDPEVRAPGRWLVLSPFPPGFRDPAFPLPPTARFVHPFPPVAANESDTVPLLDGWVGQPLVYFTLGTIFNVESGDLFPRVLAGLAALPAHLDARVIVTTGRQLDPASFGPQPPHIRLAQYIPQAALLPHCAMMVSHGGSGSVTGALAHGLPMVLLPMGADQLRNGARCADLGLGQVLDPVTLTPEDIRDAVTDVLANPAYRERVKPLQAEIAAMPGPAHAVHLIERLAAPV